MKIRWYLTVHWPAGSIQSPPVFTMGAFYLAILLDPRRNSGKSPRRKFDFPVSAHLDFCSYWTKILCVLQLVSLVYLGTWGWGHWALSNAVLTQKCFLEQIKKNWSQKIISEFLLKESKFQWKYWPKCAFLIYWAFITKTKSICNVWICGFPRCR